MYSLVSFGGETLRTEKLPPQAIDFDHFTTNQGLVNTVVYDVVQDKKGYLWFGTGNGLSRYDGYRFYNYIQDKNNSQSIGSGAAVDLYIDGNDRLWIAVINSGLYRYDETIDAFVVFQHNPEIPNSISSNKPYSMTEDGNGNLWITTVDKGLNLYDSKNNHFKHFGLVVSELISN